MKFFKSSTETTISTSLIRCIASAMNCEQVHTSVLNLILQQANEAGVRNLSKWRSEICSLCWSSPLFFEESPPLKMTEFLADGPDWHLRSWSCSCLSLFSTGWMERLFDRWIPLMQFLRIRCWWWRIWICKNVSRYTMCVPNAWRPFSAARRYERMSPHPFRYWMRWEWHWSTGNVGISTANWFSVLKILRIAHTIYFILQFLYSARKFQYSVLILV